MHKSNHSVASYSDGTYCETCGEFFEKGSDMYLRSNGIFSLFCVVNNLLIEHPKSKKLREMYKVLYQVFPKTTSRKFKYVPTLLFESAPAEEWLIDTKKLRKIEKQALSLILKWNKNADSASVTLKF